jgi:hypothetical protein
VKPTSAGRIAADEVRLRLENDRHPYDDVMVARLSSHDRALFAMIVAVAKRLPSPSSVDAPPPASTTDGAAARERSEAETLDVSPGRYAFVACRRKPDPER